MKKNGVFAGIVIAGIAAVGIFAAKGIKSYLYGESWPCNAILVSGEAENVNMAKAEYEDNTKFVKDYSYKVVTIETKSKDDNGNDVTYTKDYAVISKDTAEQMLSDQILREKEGNPTEGTLETELLKSIPHLEEESVVYLGGPGLEESDDIQELERLLGTRELEYGAYAWIGYYPMYGHVLITDDSIYENMEHDSRQMSLIGFKKGKIDCKSTKDQDAIAQKLSEISNIEINYAYVE